MPQEFLCSLNFNDEPLGLIDLSVFSKTVGESGGGTFLKKKIISAVRLINNKGVAVIIKPTCLFWYHSSNGEHNPMSVSCYFVLASAKTTLFVFTLKKSSLHQLDMFRPSLFI